MRIDTRDFEPNVPTDFTLRDAAGCLRFALGAVCGLIGFLFLTTSPSAVHAWMHRDGYRPTEVVFSTLSRSVARIEIVSTSEKLSTRKSKLDFERDFVEGPRTVLYNPAARVMFAGVTLFDERIIVNVNRDFQTHAVMATAWAIGPFSAAWLLLGLHNRKPKKRRDA